MLKVFKPTNLIILFVFAFASSAYSATTINSDIAVDTTWTQANSPYTIEGDITLESGVSLTIEPGVVIEPGTELLQENRLLVRGNINADSADFNVYVIYQNGGSATVNNSSFVGSASIETGSSGSLSGNTYAGGIGFAPETDLSQWNITGNSYGDSRIFVSNGGAKITISGDVTWEPIDGQTEYFVFSDIAIPSGSSLSLSGISLLSIIGTMSVSGEFTASSVEIYYLNAFHVYGGSNVQISNSTLTSNNSYSNRLTIWSGATADISSTLFEDSYFFLSADIPGSAGVTLSSNTIEKGSYRLHGGSITTDTTWPDLGYPYWLTNNVTVAPETTLTIASGVEATQSGSNSGITVEGSLEVTSATLPEIEVKVANGGTADLNSCSFGSISMERNASGSITNCVFGGISFDARANMTDWTFSGITFSSPEPENHYISITSLESSGGSSIEIDNDATWASLDNLPLSLSDDITILEQASLTISDAHFDTSTTRRIQVFGGLTAESVSNLPVVAFLDNSASNINDSSFNSWIYIGEGSAGTITSSILESTFRLEPMADLSFWEISENTYSAAQIEFSYTYADSSEITAEANLAPIDGLTLFLGSLTITEQGVLNVQPGVEFYENSDIYVYGELIAEGATFNNDVRGEPGGFISLKGSEVTDSGSLFLPEDYNVLIANNISHLTISKKNNTILANNIKEMIASGSSSFEIHNNNFINTGSDVLDTIGGVSALDATNNYWGDPSGPENHGGSGARHASYPITSDPWSTTPFYDSDLDGLLDRVELDNGTDPNDNDSDGDGVPDAIDQFPLNPDESSDFDGDGIGDDADADDDNDGFSDEQELAAGTDPLDPDSKPTTNAESSSAIMPSWSRGWRLALPNPN